MFCRCESWVFTPKVNQIMTWCRDVTFKSILLIYWSMKSTIYIINHHKSSRWWQLKYFLFSLLFGEDSHFDEHIFQMGWNHHLVMLHVFLDLSEFSRGSFQQKSAAILQGELSEVGDVKWPIPIRWFNTCVGLMGNLEKNYIMYDICI